MKTDEQDKCFRHLKQNDTYYDIYEVHSCEGT